MFAKTRSARFRRADDTYDDLSPADEEYGAGVGCIMDLLDTLRVECADSPLTEQRQGGPLEQNR